MRPLDEIFEALAKSDFRRRQRLRGRDVDYLHAKGLAAIMTHARDLIAQRLAPAEPPNDGRQTPWRGHPVFVAQHATATCCRGCLEKWHGIERGVSLGANEQAHVLGAIERWLRSEFERTRDHEVAAASDELPLEWQHQP
ncbi:MAG: DUF4186 domain-containing protein [Chthoniobacterales bacterium]